MKSNIDLSVDGLFRDKKNRNSIKDMIKSFDTDEYHPWDKQADYTVDNSDSDIIFCGTKKNRKLKQECAEFETMDTRCVRCGAELKHPWAENCGLCSTCEQEVSSECKIADWRFKEQKLHDSSDDRIVLEINKINN